MSDCADDAECKENYPNSPICNKETGLCTVIPDLVKAPRTFNEADNCKKLYGDSYVYDKESSSCRVPKCDVSNDNCPSPSKCWRGSCHVLSTNVTVRTCVNTNDCKTNNELCSNVSCQIQKKDNMAVIGFN